MRLGAAALFSILSVGPAAADEVQGWSLAISNDSIGEAQDRWQSSSVQFGLIYGAAWEGTAPSGIGEMLEFRLRADLLTPESLDDPDPTDRRHAGILGFGVHSHMSRGAFEGRLGADLVFVGEQTGQLAVQKKLHELLGFVVPDLDDFQIENQERIDLSGEVGWRYPIGSAVLRPFAEAQVGTEDYLRVGADLTWGALARETLLVRAVATGQRTPAIARVEGFGFSVGADIAWVEDSIYLPEELGYVLTDSRQRVRAGAFYRTGRFDFYYGLAWLGEEFEAQREAQFVGTFQARVDF